jgi:drug/metabolite transporter (DMT)-like permease
VLGANPTSGGFVERNIKVFRAHRALSWLYAMGIALIVFLGFSQPPSLKEPWWYFMLALFVGVFLAHHLTAKGARESKPWARTSSIVISVLLLFGFPLGTLIGIYLLSNTWHAWDGKVGASVVGA